MGGGTLFFMPNTVVVTTTNFFLFVVDSKLMIQTIIIFIKLINLKIYSLFKKKNYHRLREISEKAHLILTYRSNFLHLDEPPINDSNHSYFSC